MFLVTPGPSQWSTTCLQNTFAIPPKHPPFFFPTPVFRWPKGWTLLLQGAATSLGLPSARAFAHPANEDVILDELPITGPMLLDSAKRHVQHEDLCAELSTLVPHIELNALVETCLKIGIRSLKDFLMLQNQRALYARLGPVVADDMILRAKYLINMAHLNQLNKEAWSALGYCKELNWWTRDQRKRLVARGIYSAAHILDPTNKEAIVDALGEYTYECLHRNARIYKSQNDTVHTLMRGIIGDRERKVLHKVIDAGVFDDFWEIELNVEALYMIEGLDRPTCDDIHKKALGHQRKYDDIWFAIEKVCPNVDMRSRLVFNAKMESAAAILDPANLDTLLEVFSAKEVRSLCRGVVDMQLAAVTKNGLALRLIDEPCEEVILAAVTECGNALRFVDEPSEEVILAAVTECGYSIQFVQNQCEAIQLAAVTRHAWALQFTVEPSDKVILAALTQDGLALRFILNANMAMQRAAVKQNGMALQFIDKPIKAIRLIAVDQEPYALQFVDEQCEDVILAAIMKDERAIECVKVMAKEHLLATENTVKIDEVVPTKVQQTQYQKDLAKTILESLETVCEYDGFSSAEDDFEDYQSGDDDMFSSEDEEWSSDSVDIMTDLDVLHDELVPTKVQQTPYQKDLAEAILRSLEEQHTDCEDDDMSSSEGYLEDYVSSFEDDDDMSSFEDDEWSSDSVEHLLATENTVKIDEVVPTKVQQTQYQKDLAEEILRSREDDDMSSFDDEEWSSDSIDIMTDLDVLHDEQAFQLKCLTRARAALMETIDPDRYDQALTELFDEFTNKIMVLLQEMETK